LGDQTLTLRLFPRYRSSTGGKLRIFLAALVVAYELSNNNRKTKKPPFKRDSTPKGRINLLNGG